MPGEERRYKTPMAFKEAIDQRLRTDARSRNITFVHRRQMFVYERFLARLSITLGDHFIVTGGVALEFLVRRARTTKDIDLHLRLGPEQALPQFQAAGRLDLDDYLAFEIAEDPTRAGKGVVIEGLKHLVHRLQVTPRFAGVLYGAPFHIDLMVIDPPYYQPHEVEGSDFLGYLGIAPVRFSVCPPEIAIAEKLHAYTKPRPRRNSRVRDLPDIGLLAADYSFGCEDLASSISMVFTHYGTHSVPTALPNPPVDWAPRYTKLAVENDLPWPDVEGLTVAVREFLEPALAGDSGIWNPAAWVWKIE